MKVRILFFGATADEAGRREEHLQLDGAPDLATVTRRVLNDHPALERHKLLFSVNQEYAGPERIVADGDEIAIFTPVSGG